LALIPNIGFLVWCETELITLKLLLESIYEEQTVMSDVVKVVTGEKLRGAEKLARIPVKIIPTETLTA
jgi:hypothetical protein